MITCGQCGSTFSCMVNSTTGWRDNTSFKISTKTSNNGTWSHISSTQIDVKPKERYEVVTHMKLNEFATQSHIAIEGFNETSRKWYQIIQCPSVFDGPLEWHMFSAEVTVPDNTTRIRLILNAGWSSQEGREAASFFDAIYMTRAIGNDISNPDFVLVDNISGQPLHWNDTFGQCGSTFQLYGQFYDGMEG